MEGKEGFTMDELLFAKRKGRGGILGELRHAWKSITYGYKQFLCFFIAMFVCQSFCWILIFSNSTNNQHVKDLMLSEYDYHFTVENLSKTQTVQLNNEVIKSNELGSDYYIRFEEFYGTYKAFIRVGEHALANRETERMYENFIASVLPMSDIITGTGTPDELKAAGHYPVKSPLMTCEEEYILPNNVLSFCIVIPLAIVSALILMFIYHIRLNDRKFMFGIYMSFGADFKRMFFSGVYELLLLSALSMIPSFFFSFAAVLLLYLPQGIAVVFPIWQTLLLILFNFAIVFLSVYLPTKQLSLKPPVLLIGSEDNAGLVSSPRRSFRILGKKFPMHYELFGFIRFRKHFVRLLLTATLFAACFLCGIYICKTYEEANFGPVEQYHIVAPAGLSAEERLDDSEELIRMAAEVEGVTLAYWNVSKPASLKRGCIMLKGENARAAGKYVVYTDAIENDEVYTKSKYEKYISMGYSAATNAFDYTFLNRQMIDFLCEHYTVEGDPYAILEQENQVILGESLFNREVFSFSPGDQIVLCEYFAGTIPDDITYMDDRAVLTEQLKRYGYRFHVFTVAAVVRDEPAENRFLVGLNAEDYEYFVREEAAPTKIELSLDRGYTMEEVRDIYTDLRDKLGIYFDSGYDIDDTGAYLSAILTEDKQSNIRIVLWSFLILLLSPLIWLFSQSLFFAKRKKEFSILRALGAFGQDIRQVHLWSGILVGLGAVVIALLEGLLCNYLIFALCNYVLSPLGLITGIRYTFSVSVAVLLLTMLFSFLFGFLSSFIPYLSYKKEEDVKRSEKAELENSK